MHMCTRTGLALVVLGVLGCSSPDEPASASSTSGDETLATADSRSGAGPSDDGDTFQGRDGRSYRIDREACCAEPVEAPPDTAARCRAGGNLYVPEPFCSGTPPPPEMVERARADRASCRRRCACSTTADCGPVP